MAAAASPISASPTTPFSNVTLTSHAMGDDTPRPQWFSLGLNGIQHDLPVASEDLALLNDKKAEFLHWLSVETTSLNTEPLPLTPIALVFRFLQFLLDHRLQKSTIQRLFAAIEEQFLRLTDIHTCISELSDSLPARKAIISTYYRAIAATGLVPRGSDSALFRASAEGSVRPVLVFGGQGSINPICIEELADLYSLYQPLLEDLIETVTPVLSSLCRTQTTEHFYDGRFLDIKSWLADPATRPDPSFVSTAAVSFPIIGLLDLAHYCITCKVLRKTPGQFRSLLRGVTGHSQGIIVAAAIARMDSWTVFYDNATLVIELLFWLGYESHMRAPRVTMSSSAVNDCLENGEGQPSSLLSVRGLEQAHLEGLIAESNQYLNDKERLHLSLVNSRDNFVVAGLATSLRGFSLRLRQLKTPDGTDQSRIPFSSRKPTFYHQFLPISAPFHTELLRTAAERVKQRFAAESFSTQEMSIPVFHTSTGRDIRELRERRAIDIIVDAVACDRVDWPAAVSVPDASHIVVFGNGRLSDLVRQNTNGRGIRVINGAALGPSETLAGTKVDLFAAQLPVRSLAPSSWGELFQPKIVQSPAGNTVLETRLSKLLGTPPIITAGMTPTTVPWDFVVAIMTAGYHVELAGGGYFDAGSMSAAISKIVAHAPPGRGITCNLIYVSPHALAWQIPMIRQLIRQGLPIDGLTIGAGVPSPEVAAEYIETLGLKHIAFKPGSYDAIKQVISIAKAHPSFPVILQWTGGRGGGHHSYEDFHAPILKAYGEIREHSNLYLVAGSGFGDALSSYPYLRGTWSLSFGQPLMPFDGILLGSRMMVAREAHTSPQAKDLICQAPGVDDGQWERSYKGPVGGVITVNSEMGQPIHKLATRGVRFWAEMDKLVFSLPRAKRVDILREKKDYIIRRLNSDFAKPWFGRNTAGDAVELSQMTYIEVLACAIRLMYVAHQRRWVHASYTLLVRNFALRMLERFSIIDIEMPELDEPDNFVGGILDACPQAESQLLHPEDAAFFLSECRARGRKPVNFVPALDDHFETWFKKDSLWQSEDVDAVIDQDADRVCILQGPVAVKYSQRQDESAKDILDSIYQGHLSMLIDDLDTTPILTSSESSLFAVKPEQVIMKVASLGRTFRAVPAQLPKQGDWLEFLSGTTSGWVRAVFDSKYILQGRNRQTNPFRRIFEMRHGESLRIGQNEIVLEKDGNTLPQVEIKSTDSTAVVVSLYQFDLVAGEPADLQLQFTYDPKQDVLSEVMDQRDHRIKAFYARLWLDLPSPATEGIHDVFSGGQMTLTDDLLHSLSSTVGLSFANTHILSSIDDVFPIDVCIVLAWKALVQPLLLPTLSGDLLRLVHRSNRFEYSPGASPLRVSDIVDVSSTIRSITIEDSGKSVTVEAHITREDRPVVMVTSEFFLKGTFTDYASTFEFVDEPDIELQLDSPLDEALLLDRSWLRIDNNSSPLAGRTLVFRLHTFKAWKGRRTFSTIKTNGTVHLQQWNGTVDEIGQVSFQTGECVGNPVMEFLLRKGRRVSETVDLKQPGWSGDSALTVRVPESNRAYGSVSQDCNPIHLSPIFSTLAELPGTITHGMYTSAVSRKVLEYLAVDGEAARFRSYSASFLGMVLPGDELTVQIRHIAMLQGRMVFEVSAFNSATNEKVLQGEAEVDQPATAYIFTGQGSQALNMGMSLYESSAVAKKVWDDMDKYLLDQYGWSILHIVRHNPQTLTVHFGGPRGRRIRDNYLAMKTEVKHADGTASLEPIIRTLTSQSSSYTFHESRGLLFSTQFAQPAITLLNKATYEDLRAKGLIQEQAFFAGHSLGEYGALSCFSDFLPFETMLSVVFYRGLAMQVAMERDENGQTGFSMVAVSPSRVGKYFDERSLRLVTEMISNESRALLEIVNLNVEGEQYVCAGQVRNIQCLTEVLNKLSSPVVGPTLVNAALQAEGGDAMSTELGREIAAQVQKSQVAPAGADLQRGKATIPLQGIDVPFHSTHLRPGVEMYRQFLRERIHVHDVQPDQLVAKFVPNVMGKPFSLQQDYIKEAASATNSPVLKELLQLA